MRNRWIVSAAVWVVFSAYSLRVSLGAGVLWFVGLPSAHPWALQVIFDLFIALSVALFFIGPKAKELGIPRVPYVIATFLLGSVGLLAYVTHVEWARSRRMTAANAGSTLASDGVS